MAFKHNTSDTADGILTQSEYESTSGHILDSQAAGDMIVADTTTTMTRLAVGSADEVLTSDGSTPTYSKITTSNINASTLVIESEGIGSNDNDTTIPTSAAVKAYVDSQIGSNNELSEVLGNGNSTGGTDIVVTAGDVITVDTINETTAAGGVTIDSVLLKDGGFTTAGDSFVGNGNGLVVGHTSQATTFNTPELQVLGTGSADSNALLGRFSNDSSGASFQFVKSRNGTIGSSTIVQDNDNIGTIYGMVSDASDLATVAAQIVLEVDDASPAASQIGGAVVVSTATTGGSVTEALRIDSSQNLGLKATGRLYFDGIGDTYIYEQSADDLHVVVGNSTYVQIDQDINAMAFGASSAPADNVQFNFDGSFTNGSGTAMRSILLQPTMTLANGTTSNAQHMRIAGSVTTQGNSETIGNIESLLLGEPVITVGTGDTVTTAATLRIQNAPTEGTNNYALFVDSGATRLDGVTYINDTANANMTVGLTINQGANDDQAFTLKSSDVATGLTTATAPDTETDDYATFSKSSPTLGGLRIQALSEDGANPQVMLFRSWGGTATTAKTTAAEALVHFDIFEHDGANGIANITAEGNVFAVSARVGGSSLTRFLIDEDGDMYSATAGQTFDDYDDLVALDYYDKVRSGEISPKDAIKASYGKYAEYNEQALIEMGVLGDTIANGGLTNQSQLSRLLTGGVRKLAEEVKSLKAEIKALTEGK